MVSMALLLRANNIKQSWDRSLLLQPCFLARAIRSSEIHETVKTLHPMALVEEEADNPNDEAEDERAWFAEPSRVYVIPNIYLDIF